jgi:hypothetical protein
MDQLKRKAEVSVHDLGFWILTNQALAYLYRVPVYVVKKKSRSGF